MDVNCKSIDKKQEEELGGLRKITIIRSQSILGEDMMMASGQDIIKESLEFIYRLFKDWLHIFA